MTLLSRKADYALLILQYLHVHGSGNAREIHEKFHLSKAFVANILKDLGKAGFVSSTRGVKGGYVLARASATVTLAELIETLEDGFKLTVCNDHNPAGECEVAHVCPVKAPMIEIHRRIMDMLRGVTLADVFAPPPVPPVPALATLGIRTPNETTNHPNA
ncbi:MAG: Rrf2 family transcriptional regulator [Fimbriiglobus sp.]|nr:Rrf2 family transcriptional regulator [Fimbriiglobus sp.]